LAGSFACAEDPEYVDPELTLEIDPATADPDVPPPTLLVDLPIRLEREDEAMARAELAAEIGIEVPYVTREDLEISIEWTLENLNADGPMEARIIMNGANEFFNYVPDAFVIDPEEDEEPPPLAQSVPLEVDAGATISGVIREDELREASIDLELITRGVDANPFNAILANHEDLKQVESAAGPSIPEVALASMVRFEIGLQTNRAARLQFIVRVRERERDLLHEELLRAPAGELVVFAPADFTPPPIIVP